ncbi:DUF6701 domain-containing protein [Hahella sp. SMD15-11]|uniref:DUF6701 domain-containing protein n=1 Tax=Thermohahella caldifontis TaxID=3142973 RepID=A0AB39UUV1_9GAMM
MSNGLLHFGADQMLHQAWQNQSLPYGPADRFIAPYWDDLSPAAGGSVTWDVLGTAPYRRMVVTWQNVPHFPNSGQYTFQAVLYETGIIRFRYGGGSTDGSSATIGLEVNNTLFSQHAYNTSGSVGTTADLLFIESFPAITAAGGVCGTENAVVVQFASAPPIAARDPQAYTLSGGVSVLSVTQQSPDTFVLHTSSLDGAATYTLQVPGQAPVTVSYSGLMGHYFDQRDSSGNKVAWNAGGLFTGNEYYRQDAQINFSWNSGMPSVFSMPGDGDRFSIRWTGFLVPSTTGVYEFRLYSDDGMRLNLNGTEIVNDWNLHAPRFSARSAPQTLQAGTVYPIQVEHFENGGRAYAQLWWRRNGGADQVVPATELRSCAVLPPPPTAVAHYAFEQTDFSGTGIPVGEYTGNGRDGVTVGAVATDPAGKVCKGMTVPDNTSSAVQSAVNTRQDVDTVLGSQGTIAFWYRSVNNWADGVNRTLLDASTRVFNSAWDKYFYLAKLADGRLRFALEDSADGDYVLTSGAQSIGAGTWTHIAVSWDLPNDQMYVFVNGTLIASQAFSTNGVLGDVGSLYVGDNSSTYAAPGASANGTLDEIRLYSSVLLSTQVAQVMNLTHPCAAPTGCAAGFPDALASPAGGPLSMGKNVTVSGPDAMLPVGSLTAGAGTLCNGQPCVADPATTVASINPGTFPPTAGTTNLSVPQNGTGTLGSGGQTQYNKVSVGKTGTLNVVAGTGPFYINQLTLADNVILNLVTGDYYINQSNLKFKNVTLNVVGSGTVRLIFNQAVNFGDKLRANSPGGTSGDPSRLIMYGYSNIRFRKQSVVSAYVYGQGTIRVDDNSQINGALTADTLDIRQNTTISYDGTALLNADFGSLCGSCTLSGFAVTVSASALTCPGNAAAVSLTAQCSGGVTKTDYSGTINLTTSSAHGDWSVTAGNGTLSPNPDTDDNGAATYTFDAADNGVVTLALANSHADQLTVAVNDASAGVSATSSPITFLDNAFVIDSTDSLGYDFIAGRDHALSATLWRKDPSTGVCAIATGYSGTYSLKAWLTRDGADPGGAAPAVTAASTATLPNAVPGSNNLSVAFNNGVGALTLQTTDVGKYTLNLRDDTSGFVQDAAGNPLTIDSTATSSPWVVRPFGLHVEAAGNPAAGSATGPVFTQAGTGFTLNVRAVQYQSADDADGDGQPDSGANLADNAATAGFGQENPAETVTLSSTLVAPAGGNDPGLTGTLVLSAFTSGTATGTYSYGEVGIIDISAALTDSDYLGSGKTLTSSTGNVGRFIPADFSLSISQPGSLDSACTAAGTSYIGQAIPWANVPIVTITARNASGATTQNYTGAFARLVAGDVSVTAPASDSTNGLSVTATLNTGALSGSNGVFQYSFSALDTFIYDKVLTAKVAPFVADLRPQLTAVTDSDGVSATGMPLGLAPAGSTVYWGRMKLENAFGPETLALDVPFSIQYWDGSQYLIHAGDNCTTYDVNDATYSLSLTPPAGLTTTASGAGTVVAGAGSLTLSAPGAGNTGTVILQWNQPDWLQDDFDGDGTLDLPSSGATFGQYRGHDRIIYWREVVQ